MIEPGPILGQLAPWGGLLAFLGTIVLFFLNRQQANSIERFKSDQATALEELRGRQAATLEELRAGIRAQAFERETRFARLHERRIQVLAELYEKLALAEQAVKAMRSPLRDEEREDELKDLASRAIGELDDAFVKSRIWLDEDTVSDLGGFGKTLTLVWIRAVVKPTADPEGWQKLEDELPGAKARVEKRIRELLGVLDPNA